MDHLFPIGKSTNVCQSPLTMKKKERKVKKVKINKLSYSKLSLLAVRMAYREVKEGMRSYEGNKASRL